MGKPKRKKTVLVPTAAAVEVTKKKTYLGLTLWADSDCEVPLGMRALGRCEVETLAGELLAWLHGLEKREQEAETMAEGCPAHRRLSEETVGDDGGDVMQEFNLLGVIRP